MKIGIELRQVTFGASGGVAQYLQGMLDATFRLFPEDQFVVFCTIFSRSLLSQTPANVSVLTVPAHQFFQRIDEMYSSGEIEMLFRSYPMQAPLAMPWSRQLVLIPDLQHDVYPEFFTPEVLRLRRLAFNQATARAKGLLAFTDYVRKTIFAHEWTRCRDVFLAAPALTIGYGKVGELSPEEAALIPEGDFFLFPANLWPHKNHRRILKGLELLLKRTGRKVQMVLTGHREGWEKLKEEFPGLPVTHLGFVREQLMQALLAKARAVTFFTLHEGFGIPLLEAFNAGTPVLCSNTTSLPEVGGDAVLSCDPTDVEAMSGLMERILVDEDLRGELIRRGKARLAHYTWEAAARGLMEACRFVASDQAVSSAGVVIETPAGQPLVTIVTPSYNQGKFLKSTIESVLTQSYPHIQYLVMDGGSTDESVEILKSYGDRFYWKSEKDKGQSDAIVQGMAMAKGEVLAYLNSDDVLEPGAVARVVEHFRANPECDMVYGRANYIDAAGGVTGPYKTDEYCFPRLMADCCVCQPAAFWLSRIAAKVGPFDTSLHFAMDYDYWLRVDRAGGMICHIHDLLACSRLYPDTKTMSRRKEFYGEIFDVCLKHGGYVDRNYFLGYWHHLVTEQKRGWPRLLRGIPGSYVPLAWVYQKIFDSAQKGPRELAMQMFNGAVARAAWMPVAGRMFSAGLQKIKSIVAPPKVKGFLSDNWMQPYSEVVVQPKASGQRIRHVGMAPVDMKVTVKADDKVLGAYALHGGQVQAIGEDIALNKDKPVTVRFLFSGHTVDTAHRKLSFLVTETNLFGEGDLS